MEDKAPFVYPVLSTEQKLTVREFQFQLVKARDVASKMVKDAETNLVNGVQALANELGLKEIPSTFDIDGLTFNVGK